VLAGDKVRIGYLLDRKHAPIDAQDLQGETALQTAIRQKSAQLVRYLLARGAGAAVPDRDGLDAADDGRLGRRRIDCHLADEAARRPERRRRR